MNKTLRARMETVAERFGATLDVEEYGGMITITLDAPPGKIWRSTLGHTISGSMDTVAEWVRNLVAEMVAEAEEGVLDCGETDCDVCG